MTDETDPRPPAAEPDPDSAPLAADTGPIAGADPGAAASGSPAAPAVPLPSVSSAQLSAAWAKLGPIGQWILGGAIAAVVIAIVGALINAWRSTDFLLLVLVAGIAGAIVAWFTSTTEASPKPSPLPLASIEFAAGAIVAVLSVGRLIEFIFDLDQINKFGGPIGVVLLVALVVAGVAMLIGALRRDPGLRGAVMGGDQGTRLAVGGLALVLIGWALNLSIGAWTMQAATLPLAAATFAVVVIVVAPRWSRVLPGIPVAWVGAVFGVLVAILAIDEWGALMHYGILTNLGVTEYGPFFAYVIGIVGIIVGGVLTGMPTWQARPKAPAPAVSVPPTTAGAPSAGSEAPATPEAPAPSTEPPAPTA